MSPIGSALELVPIPTTVRFGGPALTVRTVLLWFKWKAAWDRDMDYIWGPRHNPESGAR